MPKRHTISGETQISESFWHSGIKMRAQNSQRLQRVKVWNNPNKTTKSQLKMTNEQNSFKKGLKSNSTVATKNQVYFPAEDHVSIDLILYLTKQSMTYCSSKMQFLKMSANCCQATLQKLSQTNQWIKSNGNASSVPWQFF